MRPSTVADFPASWRAGDVPSRGKTAGPSHDSGAYGKRFMLKLDQTTWKMLEDLSRHFKKSTAALIRQFVIQATPEAFPPSWHQAVAEHRQKGDA
jgi:hypothetical protein